MNNILSSPQFWGIIVSASVALWTFRKTKEKEREAEWRKEKLKLYLNFVEALSGITDSEISNEGEINFAKACNDLHALAPRSVLKSLHEYQDQIRISNINSSVESKQNTLNKLIYEMRKDLKIKPADIESQFEMLLWSSGKNNK